MSLNKAERNLNSSVHFAELFHRRLRYLVVVFALLS